jgi:uncharacterized membrane protein YdcZ (DUF606 family)
MDQSMKQNVRRHPLWWLLPLGLAAPFVIAVIWVLSAYGTKVMDLLNIALKMVVIP